MQLSGKCILSQHPFHSLSSHCCCRGESNFKIISKAVTKSKDISNKLDFSIVAFPNPLFAYQSHFEAEGVDLFTKKYIMLVSLFSQNLFTPELNFLNNVFFLFFFVFSILYVTKEVTLIYILLPRYRQQSYKHIFTY